MLFRSNIEYKIAEETLKSCDYKVDYVLTHTVPQSVIRYLGCVPDMNDAELTGYFEWLYGELKFQPGNVSIISGNKGKTDSWN